MVLFSKCIFLYPFLLILLTIKSTFSYQNYDRSNCNSELQVLGSNYVCSHKMKSCETFIVFRARSGHQTLSSISSLFNINNVTKLQLYNNISVTNNTSFTPGREIIIPITCQCRDRYSRAVFSYNALPTDSLSSISCGLFEGLVKTQTLQEENSNFGNDTSNSVVQVPIKCACPESSDLSNGTNYLMTYPIVGNDDMDLIARKFGVGVDKILAANMLDTYATIYPRTTLIIPTMSVPRLNLDVVSRGESPSSPRVVTPLNNIVHGKHSITKIALVSFLVATVILVLIAVGVFVFIMRKNSLSFKALSPTSSRSSNFSPDFLDGMSKLKHSLTCFSLEELKVATKDFNEVSLIGSVVYGGRIGGSYLAIEEMSSMEEANHVANILTKTNHINVVKLVGFCYGTKPFLLFEFAENCSLRDCLSNTNMANQFTWRNRMQIAFDLAVGIHYIHYCTKLTYVHGNINSRNVLVTRDWRAKISGFKLARPLVFSEEIGEEDMNETVIVGKKGYLAPEYLHEGQVSTKMDVYAFGIVLLEILSAKEAITEERVLKGSAKSLADGESEDSPGRSEKLRGFMDSNLNGKYNEGEAMGLLLLAKCCIEESPLHRPAMDDVLKALSRTL